ncbi:hypothetical protein SAY86_022756 [Trapa natans]|uniref:WD repeat-containing protein 76 n=1 Tax=Trapa natans TaxID=22666 RepID=A0AAN7M9A0_TRANT|nr:hypothetical protein SAY86_022756 [Trapa natans]
MASNNKMTEYERKRLENIRRNDEMMAALKLHSRVAELSAATKRQKVGTKTYKTNTEKAETPVVTRRSLRTRGLPPDLKGLGDDYSVHTDTISELRKSDPNASMMDAKPITMDTAYRGSGSDRAFRDIIMSFCKKAEIGSSPMGGFDRSEQSQKVENLCDSAVDLDRTKSGNLPSNVNIKYEGGDQTLLDINTLSLEVNNIARVVSGRIMAIKFFPTPNMRMIAVGNKFGNVAFWNMEAPEVEDGILLYQTHPGPVSGISISEFNMSKMFTCCYEGFLRRMDIEKEVFDLVYVADQCIYSLCQQPNNSSGLYLGEGRGGLKFWDERTGKTPDSWDLHESRINTIDFNPRNPSIMATSSSDGTSCIWDLRNISSSRVKSIRVVNHKKAVHAAYFSPSGSFLATSSFDDTVGIVSGTEFNETSFVRHNNHTGRWISTFRPIWGWDDSYIFTGNMNRAVDVISLSRKSIICSLKSPYISAIPCRFAAHPFEVGTLAAATSGGQVYTWTAN